MLKALHVAHLSFTVLCICWKFPLIKSQKLRDFQGKTGEYFRKKENEMLSEKTCFDVQVLYCSGWGISGRSVISSMGVIRMPPHIRCKSIHWKEISIGSIQQWTQSNKCIWFPILPFTLREVFHVEPVHLSSNK